MSTTEKNIIIIKTTHKELNETKRKVEKIQKHFLEEKSEKTNIDFIPYYEGFTGSVERIDDKKYLIKGKYKVFGVRQGQR